MITWWEMLGLAVAGWLAFAVIAVWSEWENTRLRKKLRQRDMLRRIK